MIRSVFAVTFPFVTFSLWSSLARRTSQIDCKLSHLSNFGHFGLFSKFLDIRIWPILNLVGIIRVNFL